MPSYAPLGYILQGVGFISIVSATEPPLMNILLTLVYFFYIIF